MIRASCDDTGEIGWVDNHRALLPEDVDHFRHEARLFLLEAAARLTGAGGRDLVAVEGAGNADARALKSAGVEELGVVAPGRRSALPGGGVIGVGSGAFEDAQQNGGVGDGGGL